MAEDIGESLVGAFYRYVEGCEFVLFNTFLIDEQGEIDVIGIRLGEPRDIYFAEVATHIDGMNYGTTTETIAKVRAKLERAQAFARQRFPDDRHHYAIWSPRVPVGMTTTAFDAMAEEFRGRGERLNFIINAEYGNRVQQVIDAARTNGRATSDPAFRMLQVLTRAKSEGGRLSL